jgi:hypothetical protein
MTEPWQVIFEVPLIRQADQYGRDRRRQLYAIQARFQEEGPAAYSLDPLEWAGVASWEQLAEPCVLDFWVPVRNSWWLIELDILPGRTIVFRRVRLE